MHSTVVPTYDMYRPSLHHVHTCAWVNIYTYFIVSLTFLAARSMLSITRATEDEAPSIVSPTLVSVRGKSFTKIVVVAMLIKISSTCMCFHR